MDDFAVVLASWWMHGARDLANGNANEVAFLFMDGPYRVAATRTNHGLANLRCVEGRHADLITHEAQVSVSHLAEQVRLLAICVAETCNRIGMRSPDVDALSPLLYD